MYLKRKRGRTSSKSKTCKALRAVRSSCRCPRGWLSRRSYAQRHCRIMALLGRFLVPQGGAPAPSAAAGCYALRLSSRDSRQLTRTGCGKLVRFTDNPEELAISYKRESLRDMCWIPSTRAVPVAARKHAVRAVI